MLWLTADFGKLLFIRQLQCGSLIAQCDLHTIHHNTK